MNKDTYSKNSPNNLISPGYHSSNKKAWLLLRILIKPKPTWATTYCKKKYYIFREIAYVNNNNELIGLGRSYLPINIFGLSVFWKCIFIFNPKPLGVVLKMKYGDNIRINVVSNESKNKNLTPYKKDLTEIQTYKRILKINDKDVVIVEEDFIK